MAATTTTSVDSSTCAFLRAAHDAAGCIRNASLSLCTPMWNLVRGHGEAALQICWVPSFQHLPQHRLLARAISLSSYEISNIPITFLT